MRSAIERLESLCVADVMTRDVIQVSAHESMPAAATVFADHRVSAAPVVDEQGVCVGILSATDFLRRERALTRSDEDPAGEQHELVEGPECWRVEWETRDRVSSHMTTAVQSVTCTMPLLAAAGIMNAEHIHRLLVLDDGGRPIGVVSTMDVVAALLNAVDEVNSR